MLGKASNAQASVGFSGSGALSHAFIQFPPLRCRITESRGLFYDDGNKLLISVTSNQVISWKIAPFDPDVDSTTDIISEGPVLSVRYSLNAKRIAILRSNHEVQIWNRETRDTVTQSCRLDSEIILGFFWTDCPTCDIVFVKTSGLDLFSYDAGLKKLHLVETKKLNVSWYFYTHESRLVLLASGMQCKNFSGYQLSSAGIIRLPRFEMVVTKSEANNKPVLTAEDIQLVTVYGRIYCLQIDTVAMLLHSYRFYRDAVVQQGSLPIYSSKIALSVVDNVLLVHQVDTKVVILYDMFADSRAPISAPLPLLLRGFPRTNVPSESSSKEARTSETISETEGIVYGHNWIFLVPDLICDTNSGILWKIQLDLEAISASNSVVSSVLEFLQRRKLDAKKVKELCLALARSIIIERRPLPMVFKSIDVLVSSYSYSIKTGSYFKGVRPEKASASDVPSVIGPSTDISESISREVAFGKSIKSEERENVHKSKHSDSESEDGLGFGKKKIGFQNIGSSRENESLMEHGAASSEEHSSALHAQALNVDASGQQVISSAIAPDELYDYVFAPAEEEMVGDTSYLVAIVVEFIRSASKEKIKVHPHIYAMTVRLLARTERFAELGLFVLNEILEPSKEVALQLLESGRQNLQTRKLGLDMLSQLMLHHDYVLLLVQDGYYLEALRYARKNKVNTVRPSLFLESAYALNDSQHLAAVLRFFSDFIPGFRNTSEHAMYSRALAEMNSSVSALGI